MPSFLFAASDIHISLRAEPITQIGPLTVTNSMIYGAICSLAIALILVLAARKIGVTAKKGFAQVIEIITEFVLTMLEGVFGSRKLAIKYAPIFGTFFFF